MIGSRLPLNCPYTQSYFAAIDECVPEAIAANQAFIDNINIDVICTPLSSYRTAGDIQSLRYCNRITGSLIIENTDTGVDFSALYDITIIEGVSLTHCDMHRTDWCRRLSGHPQHDNDITLPRICQPRAGGCQRQLHHRVRRDPRSRYHRFACTARSTAAFNHGQTTNT